MLSSKVFAITTFLVALICVVLSVTATPLPAGVVLKRNDDQETLQSDSIPVSSDGDGELEPYDPAQEVPQNVTEEGNSAQGDGTGLRKRW